MRIIALAAAGLALTACETISAPTTDVEPAFDYDAEIAALMAADRAWAASVETAPEPGSAYAQALTSDAVVLNEGTPRVQGAGAISQLVTDMASKPGFRMSWAPDTAQISDDGTLGYTLGTYEMIDDGDITDGNYMTVWTKGFDGEWRVSVNTSAPSE